MAYCRRKTEQYSPLFLLLLLILLSGGVLFTRILPTDVSSVTILLYLLSGIVILFGVGLLILLSWREMQRIRALNWAEIDVMSGIDFERYVGSILKTQGYTITFTPQTGDYGTDIVAQKGSERISVQLKRYKKSVGPAAIQQAVASMVVYSCNKAMVVTNSRFTSEAKRLAQYNHCVLVDRQVLADWIITFKEKK